ncbi:MAG: single-stranded DNA-binding protein [Candidatus Riflebacteria bacterium]|nr:single-stranded DNA-binding protein [Candidatus Riflebacteria bacterium]
MGSLNRVMLIGNLTRDPEMRTLPTGAAMALTGIAVNRTYTDRQGNRKDEPTFLNLVAFEKRAEILGKFAKKGRPLFIDGRLRARTVQNDKGESRTFHDVLVEGIQFLDSSRGGGTSNGDAQDRSGNVRGAAADLTGPEEGD